jgi:predicted permease
MDHLGTGHRPVQNHSARFPALHDVCQYRGIFQAGELTFWWVLPLASIFLSGSGIALGAFFFRQRLPAQKNLLALTGFQNATYLVLPMGMALFPKEFVRFALYDFLFVIGFNLLLWSLGKFLATEQNTAIIGWRDFLTPPAVGNILLVRSYGGDEEKIGALMLLSYMACILTMPAWLALFDMWILR